MGEGVKNWLTHFWWVASTLKSFSIALLFYNLSAKLESYHPLEMLKVGPPARLNHYYSYIFCATFAYYIYILYFLLYFWVQFCFFYCTQVVGRRSVWMVEILNTQIWHWSPGFTLDVGNKNILVMISERFGFQLHINKVNTHFNSLLTFSIFNQDHNFNQTQL